MFLEGLFVCFVMRFLFKCTARVTGSFTSNICQLLVNRCLFHTHTKAELNFRLEWQNKNDGVWLIARSSVIFMGINPPGKNIKSENGKPEDKLLNIWSFTVLNEIIKPIFNNLLLPLPLKHAILCLLVWFWRYVETRPIARTNPTVGRHAFILEKV